MNNSYWNETGKYQAQYSEAWGKLIPTSGEAEEGLPEALRAISRIGYDYYNNGFCNLWHTWDDGERTMDSYYRGLVDYLQDYIPATMFVELKNWLPSVHYDSISWGNNGDWIIDRIIDHIMEQIISSNLLEASNVKTQ
jgi:hypothetical protein